jgi:hypothetical protein
MQMIGRRPSLSAFVEESFSFKLFEDFGRLIYASM